MKNATKVAYYEPGMISRRSLSFGAALLLVGALWLVWAAGGLAQIEHGGPAATRTPQPSPTLPVAPGATPTVDRLAAPPTVTSPDQADEGAQLYWLHCQPCHGDRGQGLTDEWRAQYPPEEQYCWESGCHGERPYDEDFALPTSVPPLVGEGLGTTVLQKFETMDTVYRYTSAAMPLFFPGELQEAEYLAIMAHLLRENGIWDGMTVTPDNLTDFRLRPAAAATSSGGHLAQPSPAPGPATGAGPGGASNRLIGLGIAVVAFVAIGGIALWRNRSR